MGCLREFQRLSSVEVLATDFPLLQDKSRSTRRPWHSIPRNREVYPAPSADTTSDILTSSLLHLCSEPYRRFSELPGVCCLTRLHPREPSLHRAGVRKPFVLARADVLPISVSSAADLLGSQTFGGWARPLHPVRSCRGRARGSEPPAGGRRHGRPTRCECSHVGVRGCRRGRSVSISEGEELNGRTLPLLSRNICGRATAQSHAAHAP